MGRVDHILAGDQAGADPERVRYAKNMFPLEYLEMEPGDVLFFHCNLLHSRYIHKNCYDLIFFYLHDLNVFSM